MEEYYLKYAKPLDDLSIHQVQSQLNSWENSTKEEIDLLVFIANGVKNESMNSKNEFFHLIGISQSTKASILSIIDQLRLFCINVLENIFEFLKAIEMNQIDEVNHQLYSDIELIRNDYNLQLQNNQKAIASSEILIDLKDKFNKMKKVLNKPRSDIDRDGDYSSRLSSRATMNKASSQSHIPRLDFNSINESPLKVPSTNRFSLKQNESNGWVDNGFDNNHNCNEANPLCVNITNIRPSSQREKYPQKYTKAKSSVNVFNNPNSNIGPPHNPKRLQTNANSSIAPSSFQTIQSDIIQMQQEIQKLKEKKKKVHLISQSKLNDEYVLKLQNQNNQMWNEMTSMRKDICELTNTVRLLTKKINEITEDNYKINLHNEKLTQYIKDFTQPHTQVQYKQPKQPVIMNEIIHSLPLNNYTSDYNSNNDFSPNLITNENEVSQDI